MSRQTPMMWVRSNRFDPRALDLADRHYSRQKPGTSQFVRAGSCAVFFAETDAGRAIWATSWQRYAKHLWAGAWECVMFRNENAAKASKLIRQAVAATRAHYGEPPALGMITFVDPAHVRSKSDVGWTFIMAGFRPVATMIDGRRLVLQMTPERMPRPRELAFDGPSFLQAA